MLGGVLANRGHLSLAVLAAVVVVTAVTGPMVGYEIGRRMGDRLFATGALRRRARRPGTGQVHPARPGRPRGPARPVRRDRARGDAGRRGRRAGALPDLHPLQRDQRDRLGRRLLPARVPGGLGLHGHREAGGHRARDRGGRDRGGRSSCVRDPQASRGRAAPGSWSRPWRRGRPAPPDRPAPPGRRIRPAWTALPRRATATGAKAARTGRPGGAPGTAARS